MQILAAALLCCVLLGATRAGAADTVTDCSASAGGLENWIDELVTQADGVIVYQSVQLSISDGPSVLIQVVPGDTPGDASATLEQVLSILQDAFSEFLGGSTFETRLAEAIQNWCTSQETLATETSQAAESYLPGSWPTGW